MEFKPITRIGQGLTVLGGLGSPGEFALYAAIGAGFVLMDNYFRPEINDDYIKPLPQDLNS